MNKSKKLEHITNGLHAAGKIIDLRQTNLRREQNIDTRAMDMSVLIEMLRIIARYSPEAYRGALSEVVDKSSLYSSTYRDLKQHLITPASQRSEKKDILKALNIVKPVLGNRQKTYIDKMTKMYELLKS